MLMYVSTTHKFKEDVPVVYAFQKTLKSFKIFALSIHIKNRRKLCKQNKWEFQINGHRLKLDVKEWWPAKGVVPKILKSLENGNYIGKGTLNTITAMLSNNFEFHCSESLTCRCFISGVLWQLRCPRWIILDLMKMPCHKSEVFWRLECPKWVMSDQMQLLCHNP